MSSDLLAYLSGRLPLGIKLLPLVGGTFTFVWWVIWRGTGFWRRHRFFRILWQGWVVIITLYIVAWRIFPPPPIPIRVVVVAERPDSDSPPHWRARGLADAIERRLAASRKPFTIQSPEFIPVLTRAGSTTERLDSLALQMEVRWQVQIVPSGETSTVGRHTVLIKRRRGDAFKTAAEIDAVGSLFVGDAIRVAEEVSRRLGDSSPLERWPGKPPNLPDVQFAALYTAVEHCEAGQFDSAAAILTDLIDEHPRWAAPRLELARTLLSHQPGLGGDRIKAALLKVLELEPDNAEAYILLGRLFLEFRGWNEAESAFKLAYHHNPDDPRVFYYLSRLNDQRFHDLPWDGEPELLERALTLASGYEAARAALAAWFREQLQYQPSYDLLTIGLALDPVSVSMKLAMSATLLKLTRNEEALEQCRQVLELRPGHPGALYNMGITLIWLERYDEAIAALDSSYRSGGTVDNLYYLGIAYQRKRDFREAMRQFKRRVAYYQGADDRAAVSARERVKKLRKWIAKEDSLAGIEGEGID